jgi:hypothetical protein
VFVQASTRGYAALGSVDGGPFSELSIWDSSVVPVMGSRMSFRGLHRVRQGGRFGTFRPVSRVLLMGAGRSVSLCLG